MIEPGDVLEAVLIFYSFATSLMPLISASVDCVKTKELPQIAMELPPEFATLHQVCKSGTVGNRVHGSLWSHEHARRQCPRNQYTRPFVSRSREVCDVYFYLFDDM
jgi:hypothetical protein